MIKKGLMPTRLRGSSRGVRFPKSITRIASAETSVPIGTTDSCASNANITTKDSPRLIRFSDFANRKSYFSAR